MEKKKIYQKNKKWIKMEMEVLLMKEEKIKKLKKKIVKI